MSFESFLAQIKNKASELKTEALKFKNKEFLEAAMAGSALVAYADGTISSEEKQKMLRFIENNDALSVFSAGETIKKFQDFVTQLEFDKDIGEANAYKAIGKLKSNESAARLLVRMVISIAGSDGDFSEPEKAVARRIARELALDPAAFEL
ncbi:MAG: tellurite resistance TerB family protein [Gammaproteobacteria bacterium]